MEYCRRYNLKTIANLRDLGGYESNEGYVTKWHILFRSAKLSNTSKEDMEVLKKMGIRTVVDLRYPVEFKEEPDICVGDKEVELINVSLLGQLDPIKLGVLPWEPDTETLIHMYIPMMEQCGDNYRVALEIIAEALDRGGVLFHCAAGKDRTGIISMFLLSIAGVDELDIVADYEVSRTYIQKASEDISGSNYKNIQMLFDYLTENYGSPVDYLYSIGVSEQVIKKIHNKMVTS